MNSVTEELRGFKSSSQTPPLQHPHLADNGSSSHSTSTKWVNLCPAVAESADEKKLLLAEIGGKKRPIIYERWGGGLEFGY